MKLQHNYNNIWCRVAGVEETEKIHNNKDFGLCDNKDGGALDKLFEYIRENIDEKYEIFQKRSDIKESVIKFFTDILINNQKQALSYLKNHTVNNLESGY